MSRAATTRKNGMAPWQHWKEDGAPPYFYFLHEGGEIVVINVLPLGHLDGDITAVHRATVDFAETVEHGTRMQQIQCKNEKIANEFKAWWRDHGRESRRNLPEPSSCLSVMSLGSMSKDMLGRLEKK